MIKWILLSALWITAWPLVRAQTVLVPGESRANRHQYVSLHNAYQGEPNVADALDRWNVWDLELDVRWRDDFGYTGFYILHHCADPSGEGPLSDYLIPISSTKRVQDGFFFLNIEFGDGYLCLFNAVFPSNYLDLFEAEILNYFTLSEIYTWQDLVADGMKWPSTQELIRRGKRVAIHINRYDDRLTPIFFRRAGLSASGGTLAFYNTGDETENGASILGDRYFSRRYPAASCLGESNFNWETAFANGFSFPSTNCVELRIDDHQYDFYPPTPMYVATSNDGLVGWTGTAGKPHAGGTGLLQAILETQIYESNAGEDNAGVIKIKPGAYDVSSAFNASVTIDGVAMALPEKLEGPVHLAVDGNGSVLLQ